MPKREDEFWAGMKEGQGRGLCPFCGSSNIYYNRSYKSWKCAKCEKSFPTPSYGPGGDFGREARWFGKTTEGERRREFAEATRRNRESKSRDDHPTSNIQPEPADKSKTSRAGKKFANRPIPNWLLALLLIFALSIIGLGINIYIGSFIPFWLFLGFSCIYSIEKWFSYTTRKHKGIGKLYRLLLNLCMLTLFGLLVWSGIKLFSQELFSGPLFGSLIFLAEFVLFIWMWRVVARNSWRFPSMKLTIFTVVTLFLVFAFAGVQPMTSYKDRCLSTIVSAFESFSKPVVQAPKPSPTPNSTTVTPSVNNEVIGDIHNAERVTFDLINSERVKAGLPATLWDEELYQLSKAHTQEMANQGELFHSPTNGPISEDAWGGQGYSRYSEASLAQVIVNSWMSSPLHKAWILHSPIKHSVVSIISNTNGQYASWTFWTSEVGGGPPLVQKAYDLWQSETGGKIPWLTWLYDIKGYPNNQEFLRQLGIK